MKTSLKEAILYAIIIFAVVFTLIEVTVRQEILRIEQCNLYNDYRGLEVRMTRLEQVFIQNKQGFYDWNRVRTMGRR